ncbi:hypothetical protein VULLAG_LOCUS604 [Vulpes lagopus]
MPRGLTEPTGSARTASSCLQPPAARVTERPAPATPLGASGDIARFPGNPVPGKSVWSPGNRTAPLRNPALKKLGFQTPLLQKVVRCLQGRSGGAEEALEPRFSNEPACQ